MHHLSTTPARHNARTAIEAFISRSPPSSTRWRIRRRMTTALRHCAHCTRDLASRAYIPKLLTFLSLFSTIVSYVMSISRYLQPTTSFACLTHPSILCLLYIYFWHLGVVVARGVADTHLFTVNLRAVPARCPYLAVPPQYLPWHSTFCCDSVRRVSPTHAQ